MGKNNLSKKPQHIGWTERAVIIRTGFGLATAVFLVVAAIILYFS